MGTKNLLPSVLNVQHYRVVFGLELLLFTNLANICILNRNSPLGIKHYILFLYVVQTPGTKRFLFFTGSLVNLTGLKLLFSMKSLLLGVIAAASGQQCRNPKYDILFPAQDPYWNTESWFKNEKEIRCDFSECTPLYTNRGKFKVVNNHLSL